MSLYTRPAAPTLLALPRCRAPEAEPAPGERPLALARHGARSTSGDVGGEEARVHGMRDEVRQKLAQVDVIWRRGRRQVEAIARARLAGGVQQQARPDRMHRV
eukprot:6473248-Prymnesium_polylepis.2